LDSYPLLFVASLGRGICGFVDHSWRPGMKKARFVSS
jgi:hypothetical protein